MRSLFANHIFVSFFVYEERDTPEFILRLGQSHNQTKSPRIQGDLRTPLAMPNEQDATCGPTLQEGRHHECD